MMFLLSWPPWDVVTEAAHITNLILVFGLIYVNRRLHREMKGAYCDTNKRIDGHVKWHAKQESRNTAFEEKLLTDLRGRLGNPDSGPQGVPGRRPGDEAG